jgi:hypothetical protein
MPKTARPSKATVYYSQDLSCLRNGSLYKTSAHGTRKEPYAHYINGDFMGFVDVIPEGWHAMTWSRKDAKPLLPACLI